MIAVIFLLIFFLELINVYLLPFFVPGYSTIQFTQPVWWSTFILGSIIVCALSPLGALLGAFLAPFTFIFEFLSSLRAGASVEKSLVGAGAAAIGLIVFFIVIGPVALYNATIKPILLYWDDSTTTICCFDTDTGGQFFISPSGRWVFKVGTEQDFWSRRFMLGSYNTEPAARVIDTEKGGVVQFHNKDDVFPSHYLATPKAKDARSIYPSVEIDLESSTIELSAEVQHNKGGPEYHTVRSTYSLKKLGLSNMTKTWGSESDEREYWSFVGFGSDNILSARDNRTGEIVEVNTGGGDRVVFVGKTGIAAVIWDSTGVDWLPFSNWTKSEKFDFWDMAENRKIGSYRISYSDIKNKDHSYKFEFTNPIHSPDGRVWAIYTNTTFFPYNEGFIKIIRLDDYFERHHKRFDSELDSRTIDRQYTKKRKRLISTDSDPAQNSLSLPENEQSRMSELKILAEKGNSNAQNSLGLYYIAQLNLKEAERMFRLSANQGDATGQYQLGQLYLEGRVVAKNDAEAFRLFYMSAQHPSAAESQYQVGEMYENGIGVQRDLNEAAKWYQIGIGYRFSKDALLRVKELLRSSNTN